MKPSKINKLKWYTNRLVSMGPGEIVYRLGNQLTILQERSAVRKPNHHFSPYQMPANRFHQFKMNGWDNFSHQNSTEFRAQIKNRYDEGIESTMAAATLLLQDKIELFGRILPLDKPIQWSKDPLTQKSWPHDFWAAVDVRDGQTIGGVKWVRELNRHLHFVTLGKAYWLTGDERFAQALCHQFESWIEANPPFMGVNWSSALGNAIRVINWIWALNFIRRSPSLTEPLFGRIISALVAQTDFIGRHLSKFSSANNHLIGEAAGLVFVGLTLPWLKEAKEWRERGMAILTAEIRKQIYADGVPAEQAMNYLAFDLDFYLLVWQAAIQQGIAIPTVWKERLEAACTFISSIMDPQGNVPAIGDSDDGRVIVLDDRPQANRFRSIFASAAILLNNPEIKIMAGEWDEKSHWLFGQSGCETFQQLEKRPKPQSSNLFREGGYALLQQKDTKILFDVGPLGYLSLAAHGHADALSLLLTVGDAPILIDPGTYAYREGGEWRRFFRGTSAHNTIVIDGLDQSEMRGDFLWGQRATVKMLNWQSNHDYDLCTAEHDGYANLGITHRRTVFFQKPNWILVEDYLSGTGTHQIEQHWHFPIGAEVEKMAETIHTKVNETAVQFLLDNSPLLTPNIIKGETNPIQGWASIHYGHKVPAPVLTLSGQTPFPLKLTTLINLRPTQALADLTTQQDRLQKMLSIIRS